MAGSGIERKINEKWSSVFQLNIYHASNSHTKLPNVGANVISMNIGVAYRPHCLKEIKTQEGTFTTDKRFHFTARFGYGIQQRGDEADYKGSAQFPVYVQQFYFFRNYHPIARYQIGLEGFYKQSVYDTIQSSHFYNSNQRYKSCSVLLILGHELLLGHFGLMAQGGLYLYNPYYRDILKQDVNKDLRDNLKGWFTSRLGFNYYLKNAILFPKRQLFTGIYVKTNFSGADFLEMGFGYVF